jgi:hypothetical protein
MNYISNIHLENRILVKEGKEHEAIDLSNKYNIPIVLGTDGNYGDGAYIERVYKKSIDVLTVSDFKSFLGEMVPLIDMYRGSKPFTFCEFTIKVIIEIGDKKIETPSRVEVAVFMNPDSAQYVIKTLDPENEKIIHLNPWQQKRITRELYREHKLKMLMPAS